MQDNDKIQALELMFYRLFWAVINGNNLCERIWYNTFSNVFKKTKSIKVN